MMTMKNDDGDDGDDDTTSFRQTLKQQQSTDCRIHHGGQVQEKWKTSRGRGESQDAKQTDESGCGKWILIN